MKSTLKLAAAVLVALAALPAAVGVLARPSFDALVQQIERGHRGIGELQPQTTDGGWFQTRRRVAVEVRDPALRAWLAGLLDDAQPAQPLLLELDIALRHGPLPLAAGRDGGWAPALANTRLTWAVRQGEARAPLPATLLLRSGPQHTDWRLAIDAHEYDYEGADGGVSRVEHAGARLSGRLANDRSAFDARGTLGDVALTFADGRRLAARGGALRVVVDADGAQAELHFDELQRAAGSAAPLQVFDVTLSGDGGVADGRLSATTGVQTGEARSATTTHSRSGQATVQCETDAQAMATLVRFIAAAVTGNSIEQGPALIGELAARGVSVTVPELVIDTPDGPVQAQMDGTLPAGDGDARDMLQRSSGSARLTMPVTLMRMIMAHSPDIEASLQYALQSRLISRQGQQYVSQWRLRDGGLRINGRPVPLPL